MVRTCADALRKALVSGGEIAFIDVREAGQFGEGHPFLAVNCPYSRLEIELTRLVPRRAAPVVLMDDGDGVADKAAGRLADIGYADVVVLDGGAPAWAEAGFNLYKGVNVPSKAFGELVEHARATPSLEPEELKAWQDGGRPIVLVDARPLAEHRKMSIPGSIGCPFVELAHRLPAIAADADAPIVVHCAGRTRSIIGVESLRALGVPNPVYALRNGTQGWALAGLALEYGSEAAYPSVGDSERARSRAAGRALRQRRAVPHIGRRQLDAWRADGRRTLYVLDVRTAEEFEAGHLPYARHAPGGQLVQATDHWIATRGARVVVCDDTGLRAALTVHWLRQMGHEAYVLDIDVTQVPEREAGPVHDDAPTPRLPRLALGDLRKALAAGAVAVDLHPSMDYRAAHIRQAQWCIRPRLDRLRPPRGARVVLLAPNQAIAELAAIDLRQRGLDDLAYAPGGEADWRGAGLAIAATAELPCETECIDYLFFVHDRHSGNLDAARDYLAWETGLVGQMDADERALFRLAT